MISTGRVRELAGRILGAGQQFAVSSKSADGQSLRALQVAAWQETKLFENPDVPGNAQTAGLRERLMFVVDEYATLAKVIEANGTGGMDGGTRGARLQELEGEADYLEGLLTRLES